MAFKLLIKKSVNALAQGTLDLGELGLKYTTDVVEGNTIVTGGQLYVGLGATHVNGYAAISMVGHTHNLAAITANASGSNFAAGDIIYASGQTTLTTLAKGDNGQVLTLASGIPSWATPAAINDGTLTFSIGAPAATNNTVTVAAGTGFSANTATNANYQISVGPALTNLSTIMTDANLGFLKKTGVDTYQLDTNTYLTAEVDTLDSVTGRGATTTNDIAVGDIAVNGGNITTTAATFTIGNTAETGNLITNIATSIMTSGSKTVNIGTGSTVGTTAINIGTSSPGAETTTTIYGNLVIQGTTTTANTETIKISDNFIILNSDQEGTPTQDAGIEVERGDAINSTIYWDEANDVWKLFNAEGVAPAEGQPKAATTVTIPNATGTVALTSQLTYLGLSDTPNDFATMTAASGNGAHSNKLVVINGAGTGLVHTNELDCGTW
jgi:hypothetical protein